MDAAGIGIPTSHSVEIDYVSPAHNHHPQQANHSAAAAYLQDYASSNANSGSHYHPHQPLMGSGNGVVGSSASGGYEGGTFPFRKKEHQRLRMTSNPSVAAASITGGNSSSVNASKNSAVKNSSGSIDHYTNSNSIMNSSNSMPPHHSVLQQVAANGGGGGSGRGSPMPHVHVEVLSHGGVNKRNSNVPADFLFPSPGDLRRVIIEKSDKSLGITIQCNNNGGGIFVSTVAEKSIATRAGLQVGDQLLEVCGVNMRSATNDFAATVLRQCGNSITMLVQYNPYSK